MAVPLELAECHPTRFPYLFPTERPAWTSPRVTISAMSSSSPRPPANSAVPSSEGRAPAAATSCAPPTSAAPGARPVLRRPAVTAPPVRPAAAPRPATALPAARPPFSAARSSPVARPATAVRSGVAAAQPDPRPAQRGPGNTHASANANASTSVNGAVRLNKRLAELGLCSRREADDWIAHGWVYVNGAVAVMGVKVTPQDTVTVERAA